MPQPAALTFPCWCTSVTRQLPSCTATGHAETNAGAAAPVAFGREAEDTLEVVTGEWRVSHQHVELGQRPAGLGLVKVLIPGV